MHELLMDKKCAIYELIEMVRLNFVEPEEREELE